MRCVLLCGFLWVAIQTSGDVSSVPEFLCLTPGVQYTRLSLGFTDHKRLVDNLAHKGKSYHEQLRGDAVVKKIATTVECPGCHKQIEAKEMLRKILQRAGHQPGDDSYAEIMEKIRFPGD